tara:strand:- start:1302 stop:1586 length:285 start_codon:yes stop_codon:yes gene_type:complete
VQHIPLDHPHNRHRPAHNFCTEIQIGVSVHAVEDYARHCARRAAVKCGVDPSSGISDRVGARTTKDPIKLDERERSFVRRGDLRLRHRTGVDFE